MVVYDCTIDENVEVQKKQLKTSTSFPLDIPITVPSACATRPDLALVDARHLGAQLQHAGPSLACQLGALTDVAIPQLWGPMNRAGQAPGA